jgi:hypothetical protein
MSQDVCELDNFVPTDKKNCTVIALAITADIPYDKAHRIAKDAGRQDNRGFRSEKLIKYYNTKFGRNQFRKVKRKPITVQKFIKTHPQGRYYVRRKGHAYAIINGMVFDRQDPKPLERIKEAWKFVGNERK